MSRYDHLLQQKICLKFKIRNSLNPWLGLLDHIAQISNEKKMEKTPFLAQKVGNKVFAAV